MVDDFVDVELIQQRVTILGSVSFQSLENAALGGSRILTLETDAVKTTTSYSSPTRFMNWSTPGRLIT